MNAKIIPFQIPNVIMDGVEVPAHFSAMARRAGVEPDELLWLYAADFCTRAPKAVRVVPKRIKRQS